MALQGINGIYIGNGNSGFVDLDIVTGKVLTILRSSSLGISASAMIENPGQVAAGSVVYRIVEMVKTQSYTTAKDDGSGGLTTQEPQSPSVKVDININLGAKYKLEEFDLAALQDMSAITAQISNGLALSTLARQDLELFENLKTFIKGKEATNATILPNFSTTMDLEQIRINRLTMEDMVADIEATVNSSQVGTEEFQTVTVTTKKAYVRQLEGIASSGGTLGTELRINGQLPGNMVGGNALIKHIFIAKNNDGSIFTLDKVAETNYDFSEIEAFMWNKESIAYPIGYLGVIALRDQNDGNPIFIQRYRYGFKVLRPTLIRAILNKSLTPATEIKRLSDIEEKRIQAIEEKADIETDLITKKVEKIFEDKLKAIEEKNQEIQEINKKIIEDNEKTIQELKQNLEKTKK